jgi:hypothetical protein
MVHPRPLMHLLQIQRLYSSITYTADNVKTSDARNNRLDCLYWSLIRCFLDLSSLILQFELFP